jgi:DNA-binding GntR family transcriptional regulator
MSVVSNTLRVPSLKEAVTEEIRGLIHREELAVGRRVSIEDLATRFGVSRTPVRDALFELRAEGLVSIESRVGVFVRAIGDREAMDVYAIKVALEPLMAQLAAERGTLEQRQDFYQSVGELDADAKAGDVAHYVSLLESRRARLLEMANSVALKDSLSVLEGRIRLLRFRNLSQPRQLERSAKQHRAIALAIQAGDGDAAHEAMRLHMLDARRRVRALLAKSQEDSDLEESQTAEPVSSLSPKRTRRTAQ